MLGVRAHSGGDKTTGSGVTRDSLDHTKKNECKIKLGLDVVCLRGKRPQQEQSEDSRVGGGGACKDWSWCGHEGIKLQR